MKTVLVIDDEQSFLTALELALESFGIRVLTATSGESALAMMKDHPPDIILLDILMPGISGLEVLKALKAEPELKKIPVVTMSSARPAVRQADYGWDAFIEKPFATNQLIQVLRRWL